VDIEQAIRELALKYATALQRQVEQRIHDMQHDDNSHYLIYRVLGISLTEGEMIDLYQNKGRFLYRYAGAFLEQSTRFCFKAKFPEAKTVKIPNTMGQRPKTFEIDCLVEQTAYEIKWRDATTDGDHITKEHTRLKVIATAGYTPIRLMFYYPNRTQAIRIQSVLQDLYKANDGHYFYGDAAWQHLVDKTGINLQAILEKIVEEKDL
jgi:hypothetical protein